MSFSTQKQLNLEDFIYTIPEKLIAHTPPNQRDGSRLLVREKSGAISDSFMSLLENFLPEGSLLIVNNSKVFPSRLIGTNESGSKIEVFLLSRIQDDERCVYCAIGKPGKKIKPGIKIHFDETCIGEVLSKCPSSSEFLISFNLKTDEFNSWIDSNGYIPLPPYIKRVNPKPASQSSDRDRYQTIYAQIRGSVAAPTAGLHFTESLFEKLRTKNISISSVTLHVGAGTFLPVKSANISDHRMHEEFFYVPKSTIEKIIETKEAGKKVVCVGTTSFRCLESYAKYSENSDQDLTNNWHKTDLFIYPKSSQELYTPWLIDGIITNFHQPGSTLFMLISALLSLDNAHKVYEHAIQNEYRFFSYGDACLFWL